MSGESPTIGRSLVSGRNLAKSGGPTLGRSPTSVGCRGELRRWMVFGENSDVTWSSRCSCYATTRALQLSPLPFSYSCCFKRFSVKRKRLGPHCCVRLSQEGDFGGRILKASFFLCPRGFVKFASLLLRLAAMPLCKDWFSLEIGAAMMEKILLSLSEDQAAGGEAILNTIKFAVLPIAKVFTVCFIGFLL
ncbi:uncharacterized protein LOC114581369 [Dendrobium catenatum]|uniref:uncharacterized protein LOC114581369 n=1 Tax=Dendrobium catenatum TaxID=906689 RepID=UPI00109F8A7D|nr:uncharacterized protein LOC114581369 [Dendrobium catenatum]